MTIAHSVKTPTGTRHPVAVPSLLTDGIRDGIGYCQVAWHQRKGDALPLMGARTLIIAAIGGNMVSHVLWLILGRR